MTSRLLNMLLLWSNTWGKSPFPDTMVVQLTISVALAKSSKEEMQGTITNKTKTRSLFERRNIDYKFHNDKHL